MEFFIVVATLFCLAEVTEAVEAPQPDAATSIDEGLREAESLLCRHAPEPWECAMESKSFRANVREAVEAAPNRACIAEAEESTGRRWDSCRTVPRNGELCCWDLDGELIGCCIEGQPSGEPR